MNWIQWKGRQTAGRGREGERKRGGRSREENREHKVEWVEMEKML